MLLTTPAQAAWTAAGQPDVQAPAPVEGRCGRCGTQTATVTSTHIVSEKFTGFDAWPYGSRRLCVPCAWAYSHTPTAQQAMVITPTHATCYADGRDVTDLLTAGPLPATTAVIVPTAKRRHLLPTAQWGHVATDGLVVAWDGAAARRLTDVRWLRTDIGATWPQLQAPTPPPQLMRGRPPRGWEPILTAWSGLQRWRVVPPLWAAARILTNPRR